ncbi:MAG: SDR family NAD(P)-dependent oxidoreductase [Candidatus Aenigmarchaeota archaeon]|nr:SDR family NAD(P)-dependent oxidoreductase [Candidatus Aenigmarchaeota archaeon]
MTSFRSVTALGDCVYEEHGRIDIWVNNAGAGLNLSVDRTALLHEDLRGMNSTHLRQITEVNYYGLVYGTIVAAACMKRQKQGDIVQILSTSAFTPRVNESLYCAAKAAAAMFSEVAQKELQEDGIRIFPIYPGGMDTGFFETARLQKPNNAMNPADVADVILNAVSQPRNVVVVPRIYRNE